MRIAVIGAGIAGLGAAHVLGPRHDVELFEANAYAGGHTNTVDVPHGAGTLAVDTGFIVHNVRNYPRLLELFAELGVQTQDSEMSFAVSCAGCGLEFSGRRPFLPPANLVSPRFLRLLREIARFQREAERSLAEPRQADATIGAWARAEGYSDDFARHYLVPLCASIWSLATAGALAFPARYALAFLANHGVLGFRHARWRTVTGGSREYVRALLARFGGTVHLATPVVVVERDGDGVTVRTTDGAPRRFDRAVVATHPDEALALLAQPSADERRLLGAIPYTRNEAVLHTDERLLPRHASARAAWNYRLATCMPDEAAPTLTYSMNRLQRLPGGREYCVTLNRGAAIREDLIIDRFAYAHPRYDFAGLAAQRELPTLNGPLRTYFCGAYHGYGFHEDGLVAGLAAARALEASAA